MTMIVEGGDFVNHYAEIAIENTSKVQVESNRVAALMTASSSFSTDSLEAVEVWFQKSLAAAFGVAFSQSRVPPEYHQEFNTFTTFYSRAMSLKRTHEDVFLQIGRVLPLLHWRDLERKSVQLALIGEEFSSCGHPGFSALPLTRNEMWSFSDFFSSRFVAPTFDFTSFLKLVRENPGVPLFWLYEMISPPDEERDLLCVTIDEYSAYYPYPKTLWDAALAARVF